jgi:starch synthase
MRVWMVGTEMAPYSKVGGLGDVLGALPGALAELGCEVTVVVPYLPSMDHARWRIKPTGVEVEAPVDGAPRRAQVLETRAMAGVRVLLIRYPPYFDRDGLYGTRVGDYPDNAQRFAFLSYAAIAAAKRVAPNPGVVHSHDWQTGLVPFLLKAPEHFGSESQFENTISVHTIHNLSYQGMFPAAMLPRLGVSWSHFHYRELEFYGLINFLKAGLVFADAITTVSPSYAREIQSPDYSWGLHGVLKERANALYGILNGIDTSAWNPETDDRIPWRFSSTDPSHKSENGLALRQDLGLPVDTRPLVGLVNRLVAQKGIDLLLGIESQLEDLGLQWAILGSGDAHFETAVVELARRHPLTLAARIGFEDVLARRIYAGSDLFCMPSFFEPCGLGQMIALRYGSLPVVRRTGGLGDTVKEVNGTQGVGFLFDVPAPKALESALRRASFFARRPQQLATVRRRAMDLDFSWKTSAARYLEVYRGEARAPEP